MPAPWVVLRCARFRYDAENKKYPVIRRPATSPFRLVLVDLVSVLFGMPLRQAGLIWSFAPVLVTRWSTLVPQTGQLIHGDLNHLGAMAGEG